MSYGNTIIELEQQERYAEAGYGRLFAYDRVKRFNAMIDARVKAKFVRERNPETYEETQNSFFYSAMAVFNKQIDIKEHKIEKIDLKSAYLGYLINEKIKKPGIFRIKYTYPKPQTNDIQLYVIDFNCSVHNDFVNWYLNSDAINKKKIRTNGTRIWGTIAIFSSLWADSLHFVNKFLNKDEARIIKCYSFHGRDTVDVKRSQIDKLYELKERGVKKAKKMLVQSTGWLSIIDKPCYYHMVTYIKWFLMKTLYDYNLQDDLVGVQTDCLYIRVTEQNKHLIQKMKDDKINMANRQSTIGTYTYELVDSDDLIIKPRRVVLNNG